jgi:hypothetical protein
MSQVLFVDAHGDSGRLRGDLNYGVGDLSIEPVSFSGAYYIQTVAEIMQSLGIHY